MRTFVAILPPPAATAPLAAAVARVRPAWPRLRWVDPARWHVTAAFLGEVEEAPLARIGPQLAGTAAAFQPLELSMSGTGHFGRAVLWAGVADPTDRLLGLMSALAPLAPEDRPPRPHLTLARATRGPALGPVAAALGPVTGPAWVAPDLVLLESRPGPPAVCVELARYPFSRSTT